MNEKEFDTLTESEYRAYNLESYSSLKHLLTSVSAFLKAEASPFTGNEFTLLGTAIHNVLQGARHLNQYEPYKKKSSDKDDLIVVPTSFKEKLDSVWENLRDCPDVLEIVTDTKVKFEVPYIATFKSLKYKAKLDIVLPGSIGEIKTSSKANTLELFRKEAESRDYDLQAAMYLRASKRKKHFFIVVSTVHPYDIVMYPTSEIFINSGKVKLEKVERRYKQELKNAGKQYKAEV